MLTSVRRALVLAPLCLLSLASTGTASAAAPSPFCALHDARPGATVALSPTVSITPAQLTVTGTCADGSVSFSAATVRFGRALTATNATGTAAPDGLRLAEGRFSAAPSLTAAPFAARPDAPVVVRFAAAGGVEPSGALVPAPTPRLRLLAAPATTAADDPAPTPDPVAPKPPGSDPWTWTLELTDTGVTVTGTSNYTRLEGVIDWDGSYRFGVYLEDYPFNGDKLSVSGELSGSDIFNPSTAEITGAMSDLRLTPTTVLRSGVLHWSQAGLSVEGTVEQACAAGGGVTVSATGALADVGRWSLSLDGQVGPSGCALTDGLALPRGEVHGRVGADGGPVGGSLAISGSARSTLLPAGADSWTLDIDLAIGPRPVDTTATVAGRSNVGLVFGQIAGDDTFLLRAVVNVDLATGVKLHGSGEIARTTPGGPVAYRLGGALNDVPLGDHAMLTRAELDWQPGGLRLGATVRFDCAAGGTMSASLDGEVPAVPTGSDWSLRGGATAGPDGCGATKELAFGPGSGGALTLSAKGGTLAVDVDAAARLQTSLVPTKSVFDVSLHAHAGSDGFRASLDASTSGASFSGSVADDGTFALAFRLDDLEIGGVSLGAHGSIARTTANGPLSYDLGGGLSRPVALGNGLTLTEGSLSFTDGTIAFRGGLRMQCTGGTIDAGAAGSMTDSDNWSLSLSGRVSSCRIGSAATFNGGALRATVAATRGVVTYDASMSTDSIDLSSARLNFMTTMHTSLTAIAARITNTCASCGTSGLELSFTATGNADGTLLFVLPYDLSATVAGRVQMNGTKATAFDVGVTKASLRLASISLGGTFGTTAQNRLRSDTQAAFTS